MNGDSLQRFSTALIEPPAPRRRSALRRYGVAVALVCAAVAATSLVRPLAQRGDVALPLAAITLSASFGGIGPGLLAAALSVLGQAFMVPAAQPFTVPPLADLARLGVFFLVAVLTGSAVAASKRAEDSMREQWGMCRVTLSSIGDAVIVTDTAARVTFMNQVAESLTGWRRTDAFGRPLTEVFNIVNEASRNTVENPVARVVREGVVAGLANHTVLIAKDGTERPIDDSGAPVRGADGTTIGVVLVFRDVTERKQTEKEREEVLARERTARAQAEAANRAKDEFLATVSHELRTPLTAILGWVRLLRTESLEPADMNRALETIDRNAMSQAQLIDDLLDMSRIITGRMHLDIRPVDLVSTIAAALDTLRPAAEAKRIRLSSTLDPAAGPVMGDAARLQQVLWNLLSNAIRFTPRAGHVDVVLERVESNAVIRVQDDGQGITAEFLPYVFDRFSQAESGATRRVGGLGLGLAIVRHLVELHGGTVHADSPGHGHGATFRVALPLRPVLSAPPGLPPAGSPIEGSLPRLDGVRVLVVEDDADSRELFTVMLQAWGAHVTTAASAAEALRWLCEQTFDGLLTDINLPGEDGFGLLRKVRALPPERGGRIPAAALTAYAGVDDRAKILAAGFQAHIPKPIEPPALLQTLARLTGRSVGSAPETNASRGEE